MWQSPARILCHVSVFAIENGNGWVIGFCRRSYVAKGSVVAVGEQALRCGIQLPMSRVCGMIMHRNWLERMFVTCVYDTWRVKGPQCVLAVEGGIVAADQPSRVNAVS